METKKSNVWLELIISLTAFFVLYFMTKTFYLTALILMIPATFLCARRGLAVGMVFFLLSSGAVVMLEGVSIGAILICASVLPFVLVTGTMIRLKRAAWETLLFSCGAALIGAGIVLGYYYIVSDGDLLNYAVDGIVKRIQSDDAFASGIYSGFLSDSDIFMTFYDSIQIDEVREYLLQESTISQIKSLVSTYLPQIVISYVVYGGICAYFISRALSKATGGAVARVPAFRDMMIPKQHGVYLLVLMAASLVVALIGVNGIDVAAELLFSFIGTIFMIQGLSVASYLIGLFLRSKAGAIAIAVVIYMIMPVAVIGLGVFEQVLQLRARIVVNRS